ncbi:hypothetical protein SRHO_G00100980 [Serrasalmus rhombeus]
MAHMEQHTKRSPHKKVGIKCRFIEWLTRVESWLGQVKTHPFSELIRETVQQTQSKRYKPGYAVKHNQEHVYDSIDDTMPTAQPVSDQQRTEEPIYYLATDPGAQTTGLQLSLPMSKASTMAG